MPGSFWRQGYGCPWVSGIQLQVKRSHRGGHCHQAGKKGGKCGRPLSWLSGATTGSRWAQVLPPRAPSQGLEAGGGSSPPSRWRPRCGVSPAQRRLSIQATLAAEPRGRTTDTAATTRGHRKVAVAPGSASLWLSGLGPGPRVCSGLATEPEAEAEARPWASAVDLGESWGCGLWTRHQPWKHPVSMLPPSRLPRPLHTFRGATETKGPLGA